MLAAYRLEEEVRAEPSEEEMEHPEAFTHPDSDPAVAEEDSIPPETVATVAMASADPEAAAEAKARVVSPEAWEEPEAPALSASSK